MNVIIFAFVNTRTEEQKLDEKFLLITERKLMRFRHNDDDDGDDDCDDDDNDDCDDDEVE